MAFRTDRYIPNNAHLNTVEMIIAEEVVRVRNYISMLVSGVEPPSYSILIDSASGTNSPINAIYTGRNDGLISFILSLDHLDDATPDLIRAVVAHEVWHHLQSERVWSSGIKKLDWSDTVKDPEPLFASLKEGSSVFFEAVYLSRETDIAEKPRRIFERMIEAYDTIFNAKVPNSLFESLLAQSMMLIGENDIQNLEGSASVINYVLDKADILSENKYGAGSVMALMLFINNNFDERKTMEILSDPEEIRSELGKISRRTFITLINILAELYGLERRMDAAK
jgi:hypothetical protein